MPLSRLEVEQTAQDRWVAEVEVGGINNYRITVRGNTFAQIIAECERAYYEWRPYERPETRLIETSDEVEARRRFEAGVPMPVAPTLGLPKRVLSDDHKRAMAEGRARARAVKDIDEGSDAA